MAHLKRGSRSPRIGRAKLDQHLILSGVQPTHGSQNFKQSFVLGFLVFLSAHLNQIAPSCPVKVKHETHPDKQPHLDKAKSWGDCSCHSVCSESHETRINFSNNLFQNMFQIIADLSHFLMTSHVRSTIHIKNDNSLVALFLFLFFYFFFFFFFFCTVVINLRAIPIWFKY